MSDYSRRQFLSTLAAAPLVAAKPESPRAPFPPEVERAARAADAAVSAGAYQTAFFTPEEWETVRVLADLVIPADAEAAWHVRMWDRFYDLYVQSPMQKIVTDRLRPEADRDAYGVERAKAELREAYAVVERHLQSDGRMTGEFTLADCAACPALFYADTVVPFAVTDKRLSAYLDHLIARPSFARVLREAEPYFAMFPLERKPRIPGSCASSRSARRTRAAGSGRPRSATRSAPTKVSPRSCSTGCITLVSTSAPSRPSPRSTGSWITTARATGWGAEWVGILVASTQQVESELNVGPSRFVGLAWLVVALPVAAWLTWRGRLGWASLLAAPYWLPYYLLMPVLELDRRRPLAEGART